MRRSSLYLALVRFVTCRSPICFLQVARDRTARPLHLARSPLHRTCGINCERRTYVRAPPRSSFVAVSSRIDERTNDAANGLHLPRGPASLRENGADGVFGRLSPRRWVEIAFGLKFAVQMLDQVVNLAVCGRRFPILGRGLGKGATLRPFVGEQNDGLRQVQGAELGIDRHRDDGVSQCDVLGLETGALRTKEDRGPAS